ncbi:MAG: VWA domain-containing protein, partial [Candidatus Aminicenantes bacterium]
DTALQLFGQEKQKTIILLSDGYHNFPFTVNTNDAAVEACIEDLDQNQTAVYTIGFPGSEHPHVNHKLLKKLAEDRNNHLEGKFFHVTDSALNPAWNPGIALTETYKSIFTHLLKLEEIENSMGIIKAGETVTSLVKINKHDRKFSLLLSWVTPQEGRLGLTIKTSDGDVISDGSHGVGVHKGETYIIITAAEHLLKQPGKIGPTPWQVNIHAPGLEKGEQEYYLYSVMMDSAVKMKTGFDKTTYETGDIITVTSSITENNRPVTGLTDVTVKVTRPREGPGNWYALNKVTAKELESIPEKIGDEWYSRLQRKAMVLTQKRRIPLPRRTEPVVLHLYDDGTHGDKKSGDGIYTNQYKDTIKPGTYWFRFGVGGERFQREKMEQKYVAVNPTPGYSPLDIQWDNMSLDSRDEYLYHVELVPKDGYGNYMGPGQVVEMELVHQYKKASSTLSRLEDYLDGTYRGEIKISQADLNAGAQLIFTINGKTFTTAKIPGLKKWSLGINAGLTLPIFSFGNLHNPGINAGCLFGYQLSPNFSLVGILGYNRFKSNDPSTGETGDTQLWNLSGNLKSEIVKNPFRLYVHLGGGIYITRAGAFNPGFNIGAGTAVSLKPGWLMELGVDFNQVIIIDQLDFNFFITYGRLVYRF